MTPSEFLRRAHEARHDSLSLCSDLESEYVFRALFLRHWGSVRTIQSMGWMTQRMRWWDWLILPLALVLAVFLLAWSKLRKEV